LAAQTSLPEVTVPLIKEAQPETEALGHAHCQQARKLPRSTSVISSFEQLQLHTLNSLNHTLSVQYPDLHSTELQTKISKIQKNLCHGCKQLLSSPLHSSAHGPTDVPQPETPFRACCVLCSLPFPCFPNANPLRESFCSLHPALFSARERSLQSE
jgi:hypothetical protein